MAKKTWRCETGEWALQCPGASPELSSQLLQEIPPRFIHSFQALNPSLEVLMLKYWSVEAFAKISLESCGFYRLYIIDTQKLKCYPAPWKLGSFQLKILCV